MTKKEKQKNKKNLSVSCYEIEFMDFSFYRVLGLWRLRFSQTKKKVIILSMCPLTITNPDRCEVFHTFHPIVASLPTLTIYSLLSLDSILFLFSLFILLLSSLIFLFLSPLGRDIDANQARSGIGLSVTHLHLAVLAVFASLLLSKYLVSP